MVHLDKMKSEIKELVKREDVKYVIGYKKGTYAWRVSPSFARTPEDVEEFIFSPLCLNNLATYVVMENRLPLPEVEKDKKKKVGVIVKGCDSRAVIQLIQENAVSRDDVIIIGVPCRGVIDPKKMHERFGDVFDEVSVEENGEIYLIEFGGQKTECPKDDLISEVCKTCQYQNPVIYDILVGDPIEEKHEEPYSHIKALEEKSVEEKWEYWTEKFERCIRCYACRNICPVCNCTTCMVETLNPVWIRRSVDISENTAYHVMRAFHMAGRCISCGMCEKACPVDIPLTRLYKKVERDVFELFGYTAGIDKDIAPLLSMYRVEDSDEGIL